MPINFADIVKKYSCGSSLHPPHCGEFFYVAFNGNKPRIDEFIEFLRERLTQYVYPNPDPAFPPDQIFKKAVRRFMKKDASGEVGELLLFILIDCVYNAPQLVAKMHLKTATGMAYHRSDAIHLKFDNGVVQVFYGESKLHSKRNGAIKDAVSSLSGFIGNESAIQDDIQTAEDHAHIFAEYKDKFAEYLNPYAESSVERRFIYPILIGFDTEIYAAISSVSPADVETCFCDKYAQEIAEATVVFRDKAQSERLSAHNLCLLLLPFESVDDLRKRFIEKINE